MEKDTFDNIQSAISELVLHIEFARRKDEKIGQLDRSAFRLLAELDEQGPMGVNDLADKFQLDNSTVSRQAAALVSKGLLRRVPDPKDGRISLLEVTPLGHDKFHEVRMARKELYRELLADWPEEECKQFEEYLMRLNESIIAVVQKRGENEKDKHK
ncbi:MAG: MarR family winged helix-turn-helix transcriptional regulator [Heyndrickxia sp.]